MSTPEAIVSLRKLRRAGLTLAEIGTKTGLRTSVLKKLANGEAYYWSDDRAERLAALVEEISRPESAST